MKKIYIVVHRDFTSPITKMRIVKAFKSKKFGEKYIEELNKTKTQNTYELQSVIFIEDEIK